MLIYAFYGTGKTTFTAMHEDFCIDADEQYFIHSPDFPNNYIQYIEKENENNKIVFVNCRKGILDDSKIDIAFLPKKMETAIKRLKSRNTNDDFINELEYFQNEIMTELQNRFGNIIYYDEEQYINTYEKEIFKYMEQLITTKENEIEKKKAEIEKMQEEIKVLESEIDNIKEQENLYEKYKDTLLDAMIYGVDGFRVRHTTVAPYEHGYCVSNRKLYGDIFCEPVTCSSEWMENLPKELYKYLVEKKGWTADDFDELQERTLDAIDEMPVAYNPEGNSPSDKYLHGNYIANGYENDGFSHIVKGHCHGTYSSYTTSKQNQLAIDLIVLKGFCPDYYFTKRETTLTVETVEKFYKRHGINSDLSDLSAWAKMNRTRCCDTNEYYQSKKEYYESQVPKRAQENGLDMEYYKMTYINAIKSGFKNAYDELPQDYKKILPKQKLFDAMNSITNSKEWHDNQTIKVYTEMVCDYFSCDSSYIAEDMSTELNVPFDMEVGYWVYYHDKNGYQAYIENLHNEPHVMNELIKVCDVKESEILYPVASQNRVR